MAVDWVVRGTKQVVHNGAGLVTSWIKVRGIEPNVLVEANAAGTTLGEYISTAQAKTAVAAIIDP